MVLGFPRLASARIWRGRLEVREKVAERALILAVCSRPVELGSERARKKVEKANREEKCDKVASALAGQMASEKRGTT